MSVVSHELLLALAYVSRIQDPEALRARFFESLEAIDPGRVFEYSPEPPPNVQRPEVIPISTLHSSFGFAVLRSSKSTAPGAEAGTVAFEELPLYRTAFQFLAVLLENRRQELALAAEKSSLEAEVALRVAQLREQEERYRSIFNNRHVVMLAIDPADGRIVEANPAAVAFYGYPLDRMLRMRVADINIDDPSETANRMRLAMTGQTRYFNIRHRRADGSIRDVEVYTGPIVTGGVSLLFSIVHDVTSRLEAEGRLRRSLEEKNILLKELHHRVKNNLQVISSMLNLQAGSRIGSEAAADLVKAQNRIHALALLHEMLYQSRDFDHLDLRRYLSSIVSAVIESCFPEGEPPSFDLSFDRIEIGIDSAIPCGLIVNELVTNVAKHAFGARRGHFRVEVRRLGDGRLRLAVSDDGPAEAEARIARPGSRAAGAGIGLQLVEALAKQLGGEMRIVREGGTRVEVVFPLS